VGSSEDQTTYCRSYSSGQDRALIEQIARKTEGLVDLMLRGSFLNASLTKGALGWWRLKYLQEQ